MLTILTILASLVGIAVIVLFFVTLATRNLRAEIVHIRRSLATEEKRADALLDENIELRASLADATVLMAQASNSTSIFIREHQEMQAKVRYLTLRNTYLEACYKHTQSINANAAMRLPQTYQAGILVAGKSAP